MYKSYSKYRQHYKEKRTLDLGAGAKQAGIPGKIEDHTIDKVKANIEINKGRLLKATNALERQKVNCKNLEKKIKNTRSIDNKQCCKERLQECKNKIESIKASIDQIEGWIREDSDKLWEFNEINKLNTKSKRKNKKRRFKTKNVK